ncbi:MULTISPECIES: hypothetical protein [unclassified Rhizobium]|uniref:hypothetical protein n=1 Tax=unclassified Rhizobium TaxID=2613769 RepID=UPI0025D78D24|nr:hypothetical protein [Rhizobium sp. UBA1881]
MRDIVHNLGLAVAFPPALYTADNVPGVIDLYGFNQAMIAIQVATGGITFTATNKIEFVLTHSDDGVTFDPVTDADVQGVSGISGGIIQALKAAHPDPKVYKVGYVGNRRYLKLLADFSGTHGTGTGLSATVIKGQAAQRPVA